MIKTDKTDKKTTQKPLGFGEFVTLMALMISLVALSIDAMLPALPEIGQDLGVVRANDNQLIVTLLFLGMAFGQLIYGPLSDSTGRKPAIYIGFALFMVGCLIAFFATSFPMILAGRILQGLGAAGPRVVTTALIRDQYGGRAMAQVMSFIMAVFILVPVIAPALGQVVIILANWRAIFLVFLALALIASTWFALRQPETLTVERRIPFSLARIMRAVREILSNRIAFGYTLTAGFVSGAFLGYLNSAQQIFQEIYDLGQLFPLFFAILALAIGSASFSNSRLVMRYGMRSLVRLALTSVSGLGFFFFIAAALLGGQPPLWSLMIYLLITFFGVGILFGNMNAMAMEPLGHIAGVGAAVVGAISTFISLFLGAVIGQSYNGTVLPLILGFALLGLTSLALMHWAEAANPVSVLNPE